MAIPPTAVKLGRIIDPSDKKPVIFDMSAALPLGAQIASFTLSVSAEGAALGMSFDEGDGRDPSIVNSGTGIKAWPIMDPTEAANPVFEGAGVTLAVEVTHVTNTTPTETDQQTFLFPWAQR